MSAFRKPKWPFPAYIYEILSIREKTILWVQLSFFEGFGNKLDTESDRKLLNIVFIVSKNPTSTLSCFALMPWKTSVIQF